MNGTPIDSRNFIRHFHIAIKKAGLKHTNVHALRHTFATRLLEIDEHPKVVQELLGHANISMTLDTSSHVLPEKKKDAALKLNSLFEKDNDSTEPEPEGGEAKTKEKDLPDGIIPFISRRK